METFSCVNKVKTMAFDLIVCTLDLGVNLFMFDKAYCVQNTGFKQASNEIQYNILITNPGFNQDCFEHIVSIVQAASKIE